MIKIQSTKNVGVDGVKILVYGPSGVGKTSLARTLPAPLILSVENGLLALRDMDLPYVIIHNRAELEEVYQALAGGSDDLLHIKSVMLDSISEIAEVILGEEKGKTADGRRAYGETQDLLGDIVRGFRDLPGRHVLFTAQAEQIQDDQGKLLWGPSMPGKRMGGRLPYFFDEVMAMQMVRASDGTMGRWLQTGPSDTWAAKDRSGALGFWEAPDMASILDKITGKAGVL